MTRLSKFCTSFIEWGIITALLTPLIFSFSPLDSFTLPKMMFFRSVVLLLFLAWTVKSIEEKKITFTRSFFLIPIFIFLVINVLATIFSINPEVSFWGAYSKFQGLFSFLHFIIFFLIVLSFVKEEKHFKRISLAAIFISLPIAIHAIFQHFQIDFITSLSHADIRSFSSLGSALHLAAYFIMVMPLALVWIFLSKKNWHKLFFSLIFVLQFFALLFTFTRSAWLGLAASLIFFFLLWAIKQKTKLRAALVGLGILIIVLFSISLFSSSNFLHLPKENPYLTRILSSFDLQNVSNAQRIVVWQTSAEIIKKQPILGYGPENFYYAFFQNYPPALTKFSEPSFDRAHNQFLDLGVTTGALGILSYLGIILFAFWSGFKILRKSQNKVIWGTALAFLTGLLAYLIQNQFSFDSPAISAYFFLFLGLIGAGCKLTSSAEPMITSAAPAKIQSNTGKKITKILPPYVKKYKTIYGFLILVVSGLLFWSNLFPYRADSLFRRALTIRDFEEREKLYNQLFSMTPYKNYYRAELAEDYQILAEQILSEKKDKEKSEKYFALAVEQININIKNDPLDYQNYLDLAKIYTSWGEKIDAEKFTLANRAYQEATKVSPTYQLIYWEWGGSLLKQGKAEEAIQNLEYAVSLDPAVGKSYFKLGKVYKKLDEGEKAEEAFARAKSLEFGK